MMQPGGSPGVLFDKSAKTRMNNVQTQATRATMPFNQAAQMSLKNQTSKKNPTGVTVGTNRQQNPVQGFAPQQQSIVPTGGPVNYPAENFDPSVFVQDALDTFVGELRTQDFLESPRVKDAMTQIRLKNAMNIGNPNFVRDSRPLIDQVIDRTGLRNRTEQ